MNNCEKYFGTPERAAEIEVEHYEGALTGSHMVRVTRRGKPVVVVRARYYGVWLGQEADHA